MKKIYTLFLLGLLLLTFPSVSSAQTVTPVPTIVLREELIDCIQENDDLDINIVEGELTYIGNEPFSQLVLVSGENRDGEVYTITSEFTEELEIFNAESVQICGLVSPITAQFIDYELEVLYFVPLVIQELPSPTPTDRPRQDLTQETEETRDSLTRILDDQQFTGSFFAGPLKYAIRYAVDAGVPANTLVLLLLLPGVAAIIAASRHVFGLRGFGIFIPAALSVVFIATGPLVGIGLFLVIVFMSTLTRLVLRKTKIQLQYLPRMALLLWSVVVGILFILFISPILRQPSLTNVSIFPVLILVLLAEDFTRVQLGKSAKTAVNITSETLILALVSYFVLTMQSVQQIALLHPEAWIVSIALFDFVVGKYVGLRFMELWRFRKLIKK